MIQAQGETYKTLRAPNDLDEMIQVQNTSTAKMQVLVISDVLFLMILTDYLRLYRILLHRKRTKQIISKMMKRTYITKTERRSLVYLLSEMTGENKTNPGVNNRKPPLMSPQMTGPFLTSSEGTMKKRRRMMKNSSGTKNDPTKRMRSTDPFNNPLTCHSSNWMMSSGTRFSF